MSTRPVPEASGTEAEFLARYRRNRYHLPAVAVDVVIFTILDTDLKVLLVRRNEHPFRGFRALPGGFVDVGDTFEHQGEDIEAAAQRVLHTKTGLPVGTVYLEQLYTFGQAGRDPRMRVVSVAHYALVQPDLAPLVRAGGSASEVEWVSLPAALREPLAFDHSRILEMAHGRIQGKLDYTDIAFELVPETFSIQELRSVHEAILGTTHDPGNFRRRFGRMLADGIIERAPGKRLTASKPASVYRFSRKRP
ncbi:MAG: NUDIX hydrolase [Candidatus Riflebacteria bacterium]|nr:NUDIX hydrolase [Candidatus Riflebacteria bacterium]